MREVDYPKVDCSSNQVQIISDENCTRCPVCGKVFHIYSPRNYAYKIINENNQRRLFCSWTCLRKAEKVCGFKSRYRKAYEV
jgi:hypothetical protein